MSIFSKAVSAVKNTATKAVSAVKNAVSKVSNKTQGASAMDFKVGSGLTPSQTKAAVATVTPSKQISSNGLTYAAKDYKTVENTKASSKQPSISTSDLQKALSSGGLTLDSDGTSGTSTKNLTSENIPTTFNATDFSGDIGTFDAPALMSSDLSSGSIGSRLGMSSLNSGSNAGMTGSTLGTEIGTDFQSEEQKRIQEERQQERQGLMDLMSEVAGLPKEQAKLEKKAGLPEANAELRDLQAKQTLQTAQYMSQMQDIQNKPIAMEFIAGQQGEVQRRAGIDAMITSALVQAKQGQIQTAQDSIDQAIKMKYDGLLVRIDAQKQILEWNYQDLSREDKKQADIRSAELKTKEKQIDQLMAFQSNAVKNAMENGAPSSVISNIMGATDVGQIAEAGGNYIVSQADRLELEIQKLQKEKLSKEISGMGQASNKLLSVAEAQAAGVPYGTTEAQLMAQGVGGVDIAKAQASVSNLQWLKDTATNAASLSKGAGRTGIHELVANAFTLSEKKQLQGLSDSLRTNMLLMNTDPAVKKFFGPQMSEADVRMMTAGGTTLSPDYQTPEQYKAEVTRIYDMVNRAQAAVNEGIKKEQLSQFIDVSGKAIQVVDSPYHKQP